MKGGIMGTKTDELKEAISKVGLEEQRELLLRFAEAATGVKVLEGIRIANDSLPLAQQEFIISSHIKE
jgi:hypothetical protein